MSRPGCGASGARIYASTTANDANLLGVVNNNGTYSPAISSTLSGTIRGLTSGQQYQINVLLTDSSGGSPL